MLRKTELCTWWWPVRVRRWYAISAVHTLSDLLEREMDCKSNQMFISPKCRRHRKLHKFTSSTEKIKHIMSKKWRSILQICHSSENNSPFFMSKTEPFLSHYIVAWHQKTWEEVGISQMCLARKGKDEVW